MEERRFRFIIIAIVLFLMWAGLMTLFYLKADAVTKSPCRICAERVGDNVICYSIDDQHLNVVFYPNGTGDILLP